MTKQHTMAKSLSIIFPTLNEEKNIEATLRKAINYLLRQHQTWELVVVDNASSDMTIRIVEAMMRKENRIKLIKHPKNLGYAKSTSDGLAAARGDIIFIIDSDGQHEIKDIQKFVQKIHEGFDLVCGWKKIRHDPLPRVILAKIYNFLFGMLFGTGLHDVDCGFKAFTKELAKNLAIEYHNVPVGAEICAKTDIMGYRIAEIAVKHHPRTKGKSSFHPIKMPFMVMKIFVLLFVLRVRLWLNRPSQALR